MKTYQVLIEGWRISGCWGRFSGFSSCKSCESTSWQTRRRWAKKHGNLYFATGLKYSEIEDTSIINKKLKTVTMSYIINRSRHHGEAEISSLPSEIQTPLNIDSVVATVNSCPTYMISTVRTLTSLQIPQNLHNPSWYRFNSTTWWVVTVRPVEWISLQITLKSATSTWSP